MFPRVSKEPRQFSKKKYKKLAHITLRDSVFDDDLTVGSLRALLIQSKCCLWDSVCKSKMTWSSPPAQVSYSNIYNKASIPKFKIDINST